MRGRLAPPEANWEAKLMPQIVNAEAGNTGGLGELPPSTLDIDT